MTKIKMQLFLVRCMAPWSPPCSFLNLVSPSSESFPFSFRKGTVLSHQFEFLFYEKKKVRGENDINNNWSNVAYAYPPSTGLLRTQIQLNRWFHWLTCDKRWVLLFRMWSLSAVATIFYYVNCCRIHHFSYFMLFSTKRNYIVSLSSVMIICWKKCVSPVWHPGLE